MAISLSMYAGAGAQFFDNNGSPLSGGLIYTYDAGTTTPAATYTDASAITNNTNPIVLDSAGRTPAQIWLTAGSSYKFILQTSTGVLIKTDDNIFASYELDKFVGTTVGLGGNSLATNIAVGDTALDSNTSGTNSTAVGYDALTANTSGSQNTAVGYAAANTLTTGSNNTVIGYDADVSGASVSNEVTIGNSSVTSFRMPGLTWTAGVKWQNNGTLTVSTLPSAATAGAGARAVVTDANATTFHAIVAGGGANVVPVFSDGTNWRIG